MRALPKETVDEIRKLKHDGVSSRELAERFNCAKSTISLYCRDVFYHYGRKYSSEKDARQIPILKRKGKPRKRSPSDSPEYRRLHYHYKENRKLYPCSMCNTSLIRKEGGICIKCHRQKQRELVLAQAEKRGRETEQWKKKKVERIMKRFPPPAIEVCPDSPNQRHHWKINSRGHGVCGYCKGEKEFQVNWVTAK